MEFSSSSRRRATVHSSHRSAHAGHPCIGTSSTTATAGDLFGEPVLAIEQREALAWTPHQEDPFSVMRMYEESRRHLLVTALELLRWVDQL